MIFRFSPSTSIHLHAAAPNFVCFQCVNYMHPLHGSTFPPGQCSNQCKNPHDISSHALHSRTTWECGALVASRDICCFLAILGETPPPYGRSIHLSNERIVAILPASKCMRFQCSMWHLWIIHNNTLQWHNCLESLKYCITFIRLVAKM